MNVDIPTKKVTVQYDAAVVGLDRMKEVLAEEDYPVRSPWRVAGSGRGAPVKGRPVRCPPIDVRTSAREIQTMETTHDRERTRCAEHDHRPGSTAQQTASNQRMTLLLLIAERA